MRTGERTAGDGTRDDEVEAVEPKMIYRAGRVTGGKRPPTDENNNGTETKRKNGRPYVGRSFVVHDKIVLPAGRDRLGCSKQRLDGPAATYRRRYLVV